MIKEFEKATVYQRLPLLKCSLSLANENGWFLEFGVYQGASLKYMSKLYPNRTFYGFDSFKGLPEAWVRAGNSTYPIGHFGVHGLPQINSNVKLVKGFFDKSLPKWRKENLSKKDTVSFIHIDSDLYSSAKTILYELNDYINPGTIIVFDELCDWKNSGIYPNWREGEYKALIEWTEEFDRSYKIIGRGENYEGSINVC